MDEQEVQLREQSQNINNQEQTTARQQATTKTNNTGIPDTLKTLIEATYGINLDKICVYYNSDKPAEEGKEICVEGTNIFVAPLAVHLLAKTLWKVARTLFSPEKDTGILASPPDKEEEVPKEEAKKAVEEAPKEDKKAPVVEDKKEAPEEEKEPAKPMADPHEITIEEETHAGKDINNEQVKTYCANFKAALDKAKSEEELKKLVSKTGEDLWTHTTKTVQASEGEDQTGDNWNDADIYRARLRMRVALRKSKNPLLKGADNKLLPQLIQQLEQSSRGMTTINFPKDAEKKILISGFDPFHTLDSNPSGLVAMYFDGKTIGNAHIEAAVFPVRYEDFDNNMVENFFGAHLSEVDAILTVSYTPLSPNIDIDRFSANYRARSIADNNGVVATGSPISDTGDNFYESTIPHEEIMQLNEGRNPDRQYYYPQNTERLADDGITPINRGSEEDKDQLTTDRLGPTLEELNAEGSPVEGPGGNFLSNEIHYRVSRMRTENKATKDMPQGHLHIQVPDQHATFMKDMESLIQKVVGVINKPKKGKK